MMKLPSIPSIQSLRWRLPLLVLLGVLAPILIGTILASSRANKLIHQKTQENLTLEAKNLNSSISQWLEMNVLALQNLSQDLDIISLDAERQKPELENIVQTYNHLYLANTVDVSGMNIARSDRKQLTDYRDRDWVKNALAGNKINYQTLIGRTSKKPSMCLSTPILQQEDVIGVLGICSLLNKVTEQTTAVHIGQTGYAFVVDDRGQIIAHPNPNFTNGDELTDYSYYPPVKRFLAGRDGYFYFTDTQGIEWVSNIVRLENNWGIFILQQKAEAFQEERQYQQISILIIAATIAGVGIVTWVLVGKLVEPLQYLTEAAQQIAKGNFDRSIDLNTKDELGILARSFNLMAKQLQQSFTFLANTNEELEKRVQKRTIELENANQTKNRFLANFSHELRTPLNSILGYANIIRRGQNLTYTQAEGVKIIRDSVHYLLAIINDILVFSAANSQKIELHLHECDLLALLSEVTKITRLQAEKKNLWFEYQIETNLPQHIYADEKRLKQVLINLLSNAIKFTDRGRVTLKVGAIKNDRQSLQPSIRFIVRDTGIGISQRNIQKIFQPFEQLGDLNSRRQGIGLGLSISKELVELMGGKLKVNSKPGQGSTFWFDVDFATIRVDLAAREAAFYTVTGYVGKQRTILVVDDVKENRSLLVDLLQPLGFEVITANNGQVGLEMVKQFKPDLVLTELFMPRSTGFALIQALKTSRKFARTPVIAISANNSSAIEKIIRDSGCNDFLIKPIEENQLLALLAINLQLEWTYSNSGLNRVCSISYNHEVQLKRKKLPYQS
jgi:signal transduction histidine kinase/CheY-like chemotaxis protein